MFKQRSNKKEFLDNLPLENNELQKNLAEIELTNRWFGSKKLLIDALNEIHKKYFAYFNNNKIVIGDLGCGSGDLLRATSQWAKSKKLHVELIGLDVNTSVIEYAQQKSQECSEIQYKTIDIVSSKFTDQFDIISLNSVCHHFDDKTLIDLFKQVTKQARFAVIINDLQRHKLSYFAIKWLAKLFRFSYLAQNDGPLSVLRAFHKQELINLFNQAGLTNYQIRWTYAFRWQVIIWCPA